LLFNVACPCLGIGNGMSDRNGNRDIHNLRRHWKIPGVKSQPVGCAHAHVLHDCFAACLCGVLVVLVVCCALRVVCCGLAVCVFGRSGWARSNCTCKCAHLPYTRVHTTGRLGKAPTARCVLLLLCFVVVGWRCVCLLVQAGQGPTELASAPICYIPACTLLAGWARLQLRVVCFVCCVLCLLVGGVYVFVRVFVF
jgi:hypothetical protein